MLEEEGIRIRTNATCIELNQEGSSVSVAVDCSDRTNRIFGSHILLATGRTPNTDDLGLETANVECRGRYGEQARTDRMGCVVEWKRLSPDSERNCCMK
jgi:pyruvate/2-oxoglutarate dehydrogenase complex dihydrolipoamide dehydrogenase (E3) component